MFKRTKELESQIDQFCDKVDEGAMSFKIGILSFLDGNFPAFEDKLKQVNELESQADTLRRDVERRLYEQTLIPESRGDVLGLLENMDTILNNCEGAMWQFAIEKPDIPAEFHNDYRDLVGASVEAVGALVSASRAFFRGMAEVTDHMHKVLFFEKEGDKVSTRLKMAIFAGVREFPMRVKCATLAWHTMKAAVLNGQDPVSTE